MTRSMMRGGTSVRPLIGLVVIASCFVCRSVSAETVPDKIVLCAESAAGRLARARGKLGFCMGETPILRKSQATVFFWLWAREHVLTKENS
jgi:hypothetical protein